MPLGHCKVHQTQANWMLSKTGPYLLSSIIFGSFQVYATTISNRSSLFDSWLLCCQTFYGKVRFNNGHLSNSLHLVLSELCLLIHLSFVFQFFMSPLLSIQIHQTYIQEHCLSSVDSQSQFSFISFQLMSATIQLLTMNCS